MTRLAAPGSLRRSRLIVGLVCGLALHMGWSSIADADTASITGSWLVEDIQGGSVTDLAQIAITFDRENHAFGSSGSNRFRGPFKHDGETIGIGPLAATKKMCAPVLMAREKKFFSAIDNVRRFQLAGDSLTLYAGGGTELLKLARIKGNQPK